ncbi:MAG: SDR family oxidoreductase [Dehalococcoidales bacterium]|nr:SDR family oxidoreductase [Dehalococcoidales bacterium]
MSAGINLPLDGRVAIVTGAAGIRGMGRAIALALANAGADVAVCDLYADKVGNFDLEGTANEIRKLGRRSIAVQTDVTKESDVTNLVEKVVKEFGRIDILVNNAGVMIAAPLLELTTETWDKVIDINLKGYFLCCREVAKVMVKQKSGSIVNIASTSGYRGAPPQIPYGVSKAGVIQLTRGVAQELVPYGIRVNGIAPGFISTDLGTHGGSKTPEMEKAMHEAMENMIRGIPIGRAGEAIDVADVALFLCSDSSRYMIGQMLVVDGGQLLGQHRKPNIE